MFKQITKLKTLSNYGFLVATNENAEGGVTLISQLIKHNVKIK